jgi:outer membrane immunogenic protein
MKKLLVAGIAAAAFLSAPALAEPATPFNWSGFYIGVHGGDNSFTTKGNFPNIVGSSWQTNRKNAAIGGLHGGFQAQSGNFVYGIEGGWTSGLDAAFGRERGGLGGTPCTIPVVNECMARVHDILEVGPRAGFAMGNWLLYGTGGFARASIESAFSVVGGPDFGNTVQHHEGWFAGGGIEMLATRNFVIGVEYKHYDFSSALYHNANAGAANDRSISAKFDAVLLRLTIK